MSDVTLTPSVTPSLPTTTPEIQNVQAPAPEATGQSYTPLWMVNDSIGSNAFEMLGMRLPRASGDIAAILAQISLTLELSIDESEKNKTLSGLAKLASALGAYGVNALRETIARNEAGLATVTERVADYGEASAGLVDDRNDLNATIASYNTQISSLEGQLSTLRDDYAKAKDADKPAILAQINSVTASLDTVKASRNEALGERKAVEISIAELKIGTLEAQLADLQAQLATTPAETAEATGLAILIADVGDKLTSMRSQLSALRTDPYTESSGNSRFASIDASFTGGFTNVQNTLGQRVSDGLTELQDIITMVLAIAAQAASSFNTSNANAAGEQGQREIAVERSFEDIASELKAASGRLHTMLLNRDKASDASLDRIEDVARGLLAAISDIVQALDGLDATAPGSPSPGLTVGNRLRLGV
ncbi:hypothetical protein PRN20_04725 [Devosia sp. ZB163]|uniref:hypothetical protein n=1 Tax=Devosia sp. ZB163 TaxID=3025938 RepID=UPI002361F014|nr:hypothetical protein [Devosia sp. ZB163]MDC9823027.1 hypothetical protein [Devosia sp. ZB163]